MRAPMRQTPFGVWNLRTAALWARFGSGSNEADAFRRLELPLEIRLPAANSKRSNEADAFRRLEFAECRNAKRRVSPCSNEADAFRRLESVKRGVERLDEKGSNEADAFRRLEFGFASHVPDNEEWAPMRQTPFGVWNAPASSVWRPDFTSLQ